MIHPGPTRKPTPTSMPEQRGGLSQRTLAKAERMIGDLQDRIAEQKRQIRDLQGQLRHEEGLAAERDELKSEIADLKGEIRELTRANREHVEKLQALRAENIKLKAGAKARKPNGGVTEPASSRMLRPA